MKGRHINIVTLGCSKNVADSEKLIKQIRAGGYSISHDADVIVPGHVIINTCGFINDAKEESIDTIMRFVKAKEAGQIGNLYVMGCLAERYMTALRKEIPEVDQYFGVNDINGILNELGISLKNELLTDRELTGPSHYAYLKISEGCDRTCAFCAIPMIRGRYVSKPLEVIIEEANILAAKGVRELILIAQDLSYYGLDLYRKRKLPELIRELINIESLEWIRLHYLYPADFPEELIPVIRDNEKVCNYIDLPVQHISDKMLKLMKRSHSRKQTESLLSGLREKIPGVALRTTLIAGHPGESEDDFNELREFISDFRFDRLGVFAYSHEEDTWAGNNYNDEVPEEVKKERVSELMEIQQNISLELNRVKVGKVVKTIIDKKEGEYYTGRTEHDSPEVDQEVLIPSYYLLEPGTFRQVRITHAEEFDLFGITE
ncbi:MAG: 30S ribosomal protein S12 methylthiotransferase RimO [Bacteroidales bacterium]|nr:30S ribosomal protein S12 methylthiotransferase RimO [Bacteroidales bacterium]